MGGHRPGSVGEDLLHNRVVAVLPLGLDQLERRIGEDRVVAPDREQFVLPDTGQQPEPADNPPPRTRRASASTTSRTKKT